VSPGHRRYVQLFIVASSQQVLCLRSRSPTALVTCRKPSCRSIIPQPACLPARKPTVLGARPLWRADVAVRAPSCPYYYSVPASSSHTTHPGSSSSSVTEVPPLPALSLIASRKTPRPSVTAPRPLSPRRREALLSSTSTALYRPPPKLGGTYTISLALL